MRKVLVVLVAILCFGSVAKSQSFDLGVKGGYMYSDVNVHEVQDMESKVKGGYLLGVFARLGGNKFFFQPELQCRARTADFELNDMVGDKIEVDYKTLDIPLQVGVKALNLPMVKIGIHAGPVASFKLSDDTKLKDAAVNLEDYVKDYKSFVWSGQIGVSVDVARFVFDLSYEKGFSDIAEKGAGKNDLFMATLGVKLF